MAAFTNGPGTRSVLRPGAAHVSNAGILTATSLSYTSASALPHTGPFSVALSFLDSAGTAVAEACQLIAPSSNIYPAAVCGSAGKRAGPVLRAA
jgi:hypothetical protein